MEFITGEKIQSLAQISFSKQEHRDFENKNVNWIDIDTHPTEEFNNPELVYCNISLINTTKPVLTSSKLFEKLSKFQNSFSLILHNADQNFDEKHLRYFEIKNLKKIFSENVTVSHPNLIPLPMGIANSMWGHGNESLLKKVIEKNNIKDQNFYFNFTLEGGARGEHRPQCYEAVKNKDIPFLEFNTQENYFETLSTYKYCISPPGNALDCYRMWECLYLKVIPICIRSTTTEFYSKIFPIVLLDNWDEFNPELLLDKYETLNKWENYHLLDFHNLINHIELNHA